MSDNDGFPKSNRRGNAKEVRREEESKREREREREREGKRITAMKEEPHPARR